MSTNDMLGAVVVGAIAYKLLDDDHEHHHRHRHHKHNREKKQKGLLL